MMPSFWPAAATPMNWPAAERAFIARHPDIVLGADESWMPYVVKNPDGRLCGHDVELIARSNQLTGLRLRLEAGSWRYPVPCSRTSSAGGGAIEDAWEATSLVTMRLLPEQEDDHRAAT